MGDADETAALRARVAELEQALRNVQYVLFQEFESDGFETTCREECVGCARLRSEGCNADCRAHKALNPEGQFLPRKESNGPTQ